MLYVLPRPVIRSMCTRLMDTLRSLKIILPLIMFLFLKNAGMVTVTSILANKSCTLKPFSAITLSPGSQNWTMLLRYTIFRSIVHFSHFQWKKTAIARLIPTAVPHIFYCAKQETKSSVKRKCRYTARHDNKK